LGGRGWGRGRGRQAYVAELYRGGRGRERAFAPGPPTGIPPTGIPSTGIPPAGITPAGAAVVVAERQAEAAAELMFHNTTAPDKENEKIIKNSDEKK